MPATPLITGFCSYHNARYIGVQRKKDTFFKYYFNTHYQQFQPLHCEKCQPTILETDLHPLYMATMKEFREPILFVKNQITNQIEKYIYNQMQAIFVQVSLPLLHFNPNLYQKNHDLYAIDESKCGKVIIGRHPNGHLIKQRYTRYSTYMEEYREIPVAAVKTLKSLYIPTKNDGVQEDFLIYYCSISDQNIILVPHNGEYSRFAYNGEFIRHQYSNQTVTEKSLYPLYSVRDSEVHVTFVRNILNCKIEQYVYNGVSNQLNQVDFPELVYDPNHEIPDDILYTEENLVMMKDGNGNFKIQRFDEKRRIFVTAEPAEVKTLDQNGGQSLSFEPPPKQPNRSKLASTADQETQTEDTAQESEAISQLSLLTQQVEALTFKATQLQPELSKKGPLSEINVSDVSLASSKGKSLSSGAEYDLLEDIENQH